MRTLKLRTLPEEVSKLLREQSAPPRLVAHLQLVHDVAWQLVQQVNERLPELVFDRSAVLFGAATHDIGKALCRNELSGRGNDHELRGQELLLQAGVSAGYARFALTHGGPNREANPTIEDLLVRAADAIWKGARYEAAEAEMVNAIALLTGKPKWEVFSVLDDIYTSIAAAADERLAYQNQFPV